MLVRGNVPVVNAWFSMTIGNSVTGIVVAVGRNCGWFIIEETRRGNCAVVEQLSGTLPAVGDAVEVKRGGASQIDDRLLSRNHALDTLRRRCPAGLQLR